MHRKLHGAVILLLTLCFSDSAWAQKSAASKDGAKHYFPPERLSVMPVIFTPKGETVPKKDLDAIILRHLKWTQRRYGELLGTTFEIEDKVQRVRGAKTLAEYRKRDGGATMMSTDAFEKKPNAQSTLEHELGHTFGLPHVSVYGIEIEGNSPSLMSYNRAHWSRGFEPSQQPATMIPEDIRGLALNDRAIPNLEFSATKDVPGDYKLFWTPIPLGRCKLDGQPDYAIDVRTNAGAAFNSRVENCVVGYFRPSPGPEVYYDAGSMWHSEAVSSTVTLDLTFPFPVELTKIRLYSGHSEKYHPVKSFACSVASPDGAPKTLACDKMKSFNGEVTFTATESQDWHLELTPGESKTVVIRGLRFYSGTTEIFPPQLCLVE